MFFMSLYQTEKLMGNGTLASVILRQMSDSDRLYREAFNCDGRSS